MKKTSAARQATYVTGFVSLLGLLVAMMGWGTFDPQTGMIDIAPFNAYALAAMIPGIAASGLAAVALALGWRK